MRAAVLLCDEVQQAYHAEHGRYVDMIARMFERINVTVNLDVYDCRLSRFPTAWQQYDFFITTGSKYSVYDDQQWIRDTVDFIRQLDRERKMLIGICFGHQLIAMAMGVKVEKSSKGWGLGVSTNRIFRHPVWMAGRQAELNMIVSHQDQLTAVSDDATVIAGSTFCPYFLVQWNDHFLSVQGHPEWITDYSRVRIHDRQDMLGDEQYSCALDSLSKQPDNDLFARWLVNFVTMGHT